MNLIVLIGSGAVGKMTVGLEATGGNVYYVELVADRAVRIERNKTENRLKNKASKRDVVVSEDRMLREETKYRLVSNEGEIPFENYALMKSLSSMICRFRALCLCMKNIMMKCLWLMSRLRKSGRKPYLKIGSIISL